MLLTFPTSSKQAALYLKLTERLQIFHAEVEFSLDLSVTQIHGVKGWACLPPGRTSGKVDLPRKQKDDTGRSFHLAGGVTKVCSQPRKITELSACEERRGFTCSRIILHGWTSKKTRGKAFTSEHLQMKKVRNSCKTFAHVGSRRSEE